ncbi:hypothetical protein G6L37_34755 [Agrobacterium rubi]|nr:hypothetical protein [Agrobacterium rubi]NTF23729.1 hypothetical protein [Agrobacterium rubi]
MSTSDLYILNGKSTRWVAAFRNGWGSAPCLWDHLASKYLPQVNFTDPYGVGFVGWERKNEMVWGLFDDDRVTREERIALALTFDLSYVPLTYLQPAGDACIDAGRMILEHGAWAGVNHWQAIGEKLIELADMNFHRNARGVVLNCTSVNDLWVEPSADYLENAFPIFAGTA